MYNPLNSCRPFEVDSTAHTVIYTNGGVYSSSNTLACAVDGLPTSGVLESITVRVNDTGGQSMSAGLYSFPAIDDLNGQSIGSASSVGVNGVQTLTVTPQVAAPLSPANSYVVLISNSFATTRLLWYQANYRLAN